MVMFNLTMHSIISYDGVGDLFFTGMVSRFWDQFLSANYFIFVVPERAGCSSVV